ncbi:hypothetical protein PILCRDRAFT_816011 [Piloderma croceum F 1598]|uniref:WW domain-containing protein n=1 Tax=Piloderma croceum (strain F 1598) TaxID=765440 RepID=A0A0C3FS07_PILCF|nr:hypothetical protein PILCRDRAFT_816011 [Piloderma croceum F 1598]
MPHDSMSISTQSASSMDVDNFIRPNLQSPSPGTECRPLPISNDHDGQHKSHPVHSPTPQRGYLLPYAYGSQGSRSSQDTGTLTVEGRNSDATSLRRLDSVTLPLTSAMSLPLSHMWNSSRPESHISQPMKVSRTPTPASVNTAPPDYFSPGCPPPLRTVVPICAASVQRWNRKIVVPTDITYCIVDPLKFKFNDDVLPLGWISYTHPEGARYFFHEEKRIYTDANLYDPEELVIITESANQILTDLNNKAMDDKVTLPTDVELVLEIHAQGTEMVCGYYLVEHSSRCLFWLEAFDAEEICNEIKAVVSLSHLRYEIESQYWTHWELFPNNREITLDLVDELRDIALHAASDTLTSRTSTALWNTEQNQIILNLMDNINLFSGKRRGYSACVVGRMMRNLTHNQFVHLYGQRGARLDRDQSVYSATVKSRSLLVINLSPLLFWAPETHLQALENIWVDHLVDINSWTQFNKKLIAEWKEITIIGIVFLNANVAFLSISSVDGGGNMVENRSVAQIASYISIVTIFGSLAASWVLVRQTQGRQTADDAAKFLGSMTHKTCGLEPLAILYALPYALLMWSTLSFLVAFMYTCFFSSNLATRFLVGGVLIAVGVLVALCTRAGLTNEFNRPQFRCPWRDNNGDSRGVMPAPNSTHCIEPQASIDASDHSIKENKEYEKHQRSWHFMAFIRKLKPEPHIQNNPRGETGV